jgi:two-component system LytT family sensor kinase
LNIYRFFKESQNYRNTAFSPAAPGGDSARGRAAPVAGPILHREAPVFHVAPPPPDEGRGVQGVFLFAVAVPLKIWHNTRNEKKLDEQGRLLVEARLAALTSQINPHFSLQYLELGVFAHPQRSQPRRASWS